MMRWNKYRKLIYAVAGALALNHCPAAWADLSVGHLNITGYVSDDPDKFSFVVWMNLAAGSQLTFTDNGFTGTAFTNTEGTVTWTAPAGGYTAGSVIVFSSGAFDSGTASTTGSFLLSTSGDQLFAFEGGSVALSEVLYGFSGNGAWTTTGTINSESSYLPTALNVANGNVAFGEVDNYEYEVALRTVAQSVASHQASIAVGSNWDTNNGNLTLNSTDFVIAAVPEPTAFLFGAVVCGVIGFSTVGRRLVARLFSQRAA